jgi:hypothetical protein
MKKVREKAKTARGTATKSFGAQWLVVVTSASLISLFVVMPYTVGYFLYLDPVFLPFFSIADYYLFSAFPLLTAVVIFALQYVVSHQGAMLGRYLESRLHLSLPRNRRRLGYLIPIISAVFILFAAVAFLYLVGGNLRRGLSAEWAAVIVIMAVVALLIFFGVSRNWNGPYYYASILVFSILFLVAWGYLNAHDALHDRKRIVVAPQSNENLKIHANLFFAGAQGVVLINPHGTFFVHIDGGTTFWSGKPKFVGICPNWLQPIRERLRVPCIPYHLLALDMREANVDEEEKPEITVRE